MLDLAVNNVCYKHTESTVGYENDEGRKRDRRFRPGEHQRHLE